MKKYINNLSNYQKIKYLVILVIFVLFISVGIPTLARIKNRNIIIPVTSWDGVIATSYNSGTGTENDPYIITTGGELAYFSLMLETNNYENTYFKLTRDIILNEGILSYDETNGLVLILNNETYYIREYTNNYYDNVEREGEVVGTINLLNPLKNFKGNFDGASFRIKGMYITDITANELALFTNLEGSVKDLYVENAIVYGGTITGGIASSTNNATLKNIIFNGHVVGRNNLVDKEEHITLSNPTIYVPLIETIENLSLVNNIPFEGSEIISTSLTGTCVVTSPNGGTTTLKINNEIVSCDGFNLNLGTSLLDNVSISSVTDALDVTITFSNLTYHVNYRKNVAGGIAAVAKNSTLTNLINKGTITGASVTGGIIGVDINSSLNRSYNTGIINTSNISGGLIGSIEKSDSNIVIDKCYNANPITLDISGGLVGVIKNNSGSVSINNSFDSASSTYLIHNSNGTVIINNSYYVTSTPINDGILTNSFTQTTLNNLSTKDYIITNLGYSEFIDLNDLFTTETNAWIYDNYSLPILFIDDVNAPVANINVSTSSWNNYTTEVGSLNFTTNIMFSIENINNTTPARARYYYLSNRVLSKSELEESRNGLEPFTWTEYTNATTISVDGNYIIYAKVIDYNNYTSYLNSDLLVLDKTGPSITISLDSNNWNIVNATPNALYINQNKSVSIATSDTLGQVVSTEYYLTNAVVNPSDITEWTSYTEPISLTELGTYIVYVKSVDSNNNISYANTDYIIYNGYTETFSIGKNNANYGVNNITDKSLVTLNFTFNGSANNANLYTHKLVSSINIPSNTKLTLKDNVNNKTYEYIVTEETSAIPFTSFKEIGVGSTTKMYVESAYYLEGVINENFTITIDLANTNIQTNYMDVRMYLELTDNDNVVRPTLNSSIANFNILASANNLSTAASLNLSTTYTGNRMIFNSNTSMNIDFTSSLLFSTINGQNIIDTTHENETMGIAIRMVDSTGNIMGSDYLKNVKFKLDNVDYYPSSDNITRISLNEGVSANKILTIITNQNDNNFTEGTYYFKINNYITTGGIYYETLSANEISVPVLVTNTYTESNYSFDVIMEDANKIISKSTANVVMPLKILKNGYLYNPNIRVSLYKKDTMSAYNQNYSIVDLGTHVTNELTLVGNNVYYVTETPINFNGTLESYNLLDLNLITNNFDNTGYKLAFELFAGNKKIGTIEKYFIVK